MTHILPSGSQGLAKARRWKGCGTKAAFEVIFGLAEADPAKAHVLMYFGHFIADGRAEWEVLDDGNIKLRFHTGEMFLLAEKTILRLS